MSATTVAAITVIAVTGVAITVGTITVGAMVTPGGTTLILIIILTIILIIIPILLLLASAGVVGVGNGVAIVAAKARFDRAGTSRHYFSLCGAIFLSSALSASESPFAPAQFS